MEYGWQELHCIGIPLLTLLPQHLHRHLTDVPVTLHLAPVDVTLHHVRPGSDLLQQRRHRRSDDLRAGVSGVGEGGEL